MSLALIPLNNPSTTYASLENPADELALVTQKTTNKVQKTLKLLAQVPGSLSLAMPLSLLVFSAGGASAILHFYNQKKASDELKKAILDFESIPDNKTPAVVFDDRLVIDKALQWNKNSRAISTIALSWMQSPLPPQSNFQNDLINYLKRFNSVLEEPILTSAFIYLEKLVTSKNPNKIHIDRSNIFKCITVCLNFAVKYHLEYHETNTWFVQSTGIDKKEFNSLERELFAHLDNNITVTPDEITEAQNRFNALSQYT